MTRAARLWDVVLVVVALPVLAPLAALVAIAVWLDSPGPILFRSHRIGREGRPFVMFKFRTMRHEAIGPPLSVRGDERYTPFGRTLAGSRLDELPQLWNVLRGDMRLVGPRPEVEDFVRDFAEQYERILMIPPGLTGPAQVEYAWEGEILAEAQAADRARMYRESILPLKVVIDQRYVDQHTVAGDMLLLVRTALLPAVRAWRLGVRVVASDSGPGRAVTLMWTAVFAVGVVALIFLLATEAAAPL
jgi:lipopolysaccharide/colanic/teichoic acid biosynthesis glycosyltransferase